MRIDPLINPDGSTDMHRLLISENQWNISVHQWINNRLKMENQKQYLYQSECSHIINACFDLHNALGAGFLEPVYQEALAHEFMSRGIPFEREKRLDVFYKEIKLVKFYVADFVCYDKIILEIKAKDGIIEEHIAQVLNYLKATSFKLGLLINFGMPRVQIKRVIL